MAFGPNWENGTTTYEYTRAHKLAHISYGLLHKHPWRWEVCAWQVWTKMFQRWGPFLKNMYLTLCQFSKKNLIRYVLGKVSNFDLIFYVIRTLHKKSRQSLRSSTGRIGWDFFSKIGILSAKVYTKKVPNFEIVWPTPGTLRPLTVKGVYLVSHSLVCASFWDGV